MAYGIYVQDAVQGGTYRSGFAEGYLKSDDRLTPWMGDAKSFETADLALRAMLRLGLANSTSVRPGRVTAYVVHLLP